MQSHLSSVRFSRMRIKHFWWQTNSKFSGSVGCILLFAQPFHHLSFWIESIATVYSLVEKHSFSGADAPISSTTKCLCGILLPISSTCSRFVWNGKSEIHSFDYACTIKQKKYKSWNALSSSSIPPEYRESGRQNRAIARESDETPRRGKWW